MAGIVPRDVIPEPLIPQHVPSYPVMPVDPTIPNVLEHVSRIAQEVGSTFSHIQARQQLAADATELAKRTMGFENDLDTLTDNIKSTRDLHKTAPDEYTQGVNELSQKWTKDLRPGIETTLTKNLAPRPAKKRASTSSLKKEGLPSLSRSA